MPLPKILAPLLPRYRSTRTIKDKDESNVKGFSLSPPGLPFSPPQLESSTTNDNGDPIIEVATEEDCNASSENVIPEALVDQEATENAVVLHQSPTSMKSYEENNVIELVDNEEEPAQKKGETIAESIGNEEETFDKDMMRDNTYVHSTTSNSSTAPEIDFAPPAEFMNEDMVLTPPPLLIDTTTEEIEATMVPSPDSLPNDNEVQLEETQYEFSTPIQAESTQPSEVAPYHPIEQEFIQPQAETITPVQDVFIKHIQQDIFMKPSQDIFAKPTPTKSVSNASESSYTESEPSEANFAMKTTFHKTDGVKSKWMKMLSSAKGLVCKPERIEEVTTVYSYLFIELHSNFVCFFNKLESTHQVCT